MIEQHVTPDALADMPFWTKADDAELDLLVLEFVDIVALHHDRCPHCIGHLDDGYPWCRPLRQLWSGIVDWMRHRRLESESVWLRRLQTSADMVEDEPERFAALYGSAT